MAPTPLTWAALLALVSTSAGCSGSPFGPACDTNGLPPDDPCFMRSCCDSVQVVVLPDGGVAPVPDGGAGDAPTQWRICGACNG